MREKRFTLTVVLSLIAYSLLIFVYIHQTFLTKDMFAYFVKRFDTIEKKIDCLEQKELVNVKENKKLFIKQ